LIKKLLSTKFRSDAQAQHFTGGSQLLSQYRVVGSALLQLEESQRSLGHISPTNYRCFREAVSPIRVEILESYLDDLLDPRVHDLQLFIERPGLNVVRASCSLLGLIVAVAMGLHAAVTGASLYVSLGITVLLAVPFGVLWHFAPRAGNARRLMLAQVVSHEARRRRGIFHDDEGMPLTRLSGWRELLRPKQFPNPKGVTRSAKLHGGVGVLRSRNPGA
jgi:hypothetical protein